MTNPYCDAAGIDPPRLERVKDHPQANWYSLLVVALLERGAAMTLVEVADRFDAAGITTAHAALRSLKRCKPGRVPVYREGDDYTLDPRDEELGLWLFRLGLRPPRSERPAEIPIEPPPDPRQPLTVAELDEAWRGKDLRHWSAQRLAVAVLDARDTPSKPEEVVAFVSARGTEHRLAEDGAQFWRRSSAVRVRDDGRWELDPEHDAIRSARMAVRDRIAADRRRAAWRPDPAAIEAQLQAAKARREARAREFASLRRVLVRAFPPKAPEVVVLLDVERRELATYLANELDQARERLADYDWIGAIDVRSLMRALGFEAGERRQVELGPPQKSRTLNRSGRTLTITANLLTLGSCGISRPFGDPKKMRQYVREAQTTRLRRRLEADAKSLYALYEYGRLHGYLRLRWGFLDEIISAPWSHDGGESLHDLIDRAAQLGGLLEVVVGSAPGWADPWARARHCRVLPSARFGSELVDEEGRMVDPVDVQGARVP